MKNCLLTKLQEGVTPESNFQKLGELRLIFKENPNVSTPNSNRQQLQIGFSASTKLTIIGDGNFVNSSGVIVGKEIMSTPVNNFIAYISTDVRCVSIEKKSNITRLGSSTTPIHLFNVTTSPICLANDLKDFEYIDTLSIVINSPLLTGNIESLSKMPSLTYIRLIAYNNYLEGDIGSLYVFNGLSNLYFDCFSNPIYNNIFGTTNGLNLSINLVDFYLTESFANINTSIISGCINLITLNISNASRKGSTTGNLSDFTSLVNLQTLHLVKTDIEGDVSAFSDNTVLNNFDIRSSSKMVGNIAKVAPTSCYVVNNSRVDSEILPYSSFTYETDSRRTFILTLLNVKIDSGVDQYLIDMASLPLNSSSTYKSIVIYGTRTSASDSAVATLQGKGLSVTVIPS